MNIDNLCMGCMSELYGEEKCPNCGFYVNTPQISPYLPLKSQIGDRYIIGKVMNSNAEGVTYMGFDTVRKESVVIREYLPENFSQRTIDSTALFVTEGKEELYEKYLGKFLDLWRKLARLRGLSALVPVVDIIEDNNTAYAITEHVESITLREFLLKSQTGYLNWSKAKVLFMPVLGAVSKIHDLGIIHGGINPDNLLIGRDGKLRLTGFSVPEVHNEGNDFSPEFFDGYTPIEQYGYNYNFGVWSDIYAFSAVIYRALVGSVPQDAVSRSVNDQLLIPARFAEVIPIYVINALMNGLQLEPDSRTLDAETLREELSGTPANVVSSFSGASVQPKETKPAETPPQPEKKTSSTSKIVLITFLSIVCAGLLIFGGYMVYEHYFSEKTPTETEEEMPKEKSFVVVDFRYGTAGQNLTFDEIANSTAQQKRFVISKKEAYSSEVPAGYIIEQSIAPDMVVPYGTAIEFTVSLGKEYVPIPDIMNLMKDDAVRLLEEAGFKVSVATDVNDGTQVADSVGQVTPAVGEKLEKGATVYIHVWGELPSTEPETSEQSDLGWLGNLPNIGEIVP